MKLVKTLSAIIRSAWPHRHHREWRPSRCSLSSHRKITKASRRPIFELVDVSWLYCFRTAFECGCRAVSCAPAHKRKIHDWGIYHLNVSCPIKNALFDYWFLTTSFRNKQHLLSKCYFKCLVKKCEAILSYRWALIQWYFQSMQVLFKNKSFLENPFYNKTGRGAGTKFLPKKNHSFVCLKRRPVNMQCRSLI